ncbi:hypothetical protein [Massilimicrobiota sp. An142]|uniref:hypothetical protein n=1 Tax=Massilimicrobiota sp. An142 TaxID=1965564 RepID=UPI001F156B67|nr:hypothetical protein [Massilimicrobiota sp. An142]
MAKMKVNDFCKKAIEVEKIKTLYGWGNFMNAKNGIYTLCDCSGLIKGILWGYPEKGIYASNGVPDINANTMISRCSEVTTNFKKIKTGWLVWMEGHIGIYVGNGVVVESSPKWENGIQKTYCVGSPYKNSAKLNERKWSKCGKFDKYVDYSQETQKPSKPSTSTNYYPKYTGSSNSISDALKSIGVDNSYNNRAKIAKINGISNYTGTASQNTKLLKLLKDGKLKKTSTSTTNYYPKYTGSSNSISDALKSIGVDNSYDNRAKIAKINGISNYTGTASQNTKLLNLLKDGKLKK